MRGRANLEWIGHIQLGKMGRCHESRVQTTRRSALAVYSTPILISTSVRNGRDYVPVTSVLKNAKQSPFFFPISEVVEPTIPGGGCRPPYLDTTQGSLATEWRKLTEQSQLLSGIC